MRALVWHGRRDVRLEDVPDAPPPGADEVRLDVEWCGICGTDVEEYVAGPIVIPTQPHPLTGLCAPMIIGHEVAGRVADVGSSVTGLRPGDLVGVDGVFTCGECSACRRHQLTGCAKLASIGMHYPGGLAERMTVPAFTCLPFPSGTPAEHAALAEPFSVAVRALTRGRLHPGERVGVLGAGPIGLAVLQCARAFGASSVTVVDPVPQRRAAALALGASSALSPGSRLGGPDVVVECTGAADVPTQAIELPRPGGRVVLVGVPTEPATVDWFRVLWREVEIIGCVGHVWDEDFRIAVELIASGRVDVAPMITDRIPLERAVPDGIERLAQGARGDTIKILIGP